jgi:hypothetical protein
VIFTKAALTATSLFLIFIATVARANERVEICAEYTDTGRRYHVTAIATSGIELDLATQSHDYNVRARYIVIFWAQDQASVIEMGTGFIAPSHFAHSGTDQEGRSWEISWYSPAKCR